MATLTEQISIDSRELSDVLRVLDGVLTRRPDLAGEIEQFVFGGGESLLPDRVEFSLVPTSGADTKTVSLKVSESFREFVAALIARDCEGQGADVVQENISGELTAGTFSLPEIAGPA